MFLVLLPLARKHPWTIEGVAHHLCPRTRSPLTVPIVPSFFSFTHVNLLSAPLNDYYLSLLMKFAMITFAAAVSALIAAAAIDLGSVVQSDIDLVSSAFAIVGDSLGEKVESLSLVQPTSLRREADIDQSAGPSGYSKCFVDASDDDGEHDTIMMTNQYVKTEQKLVFVHIPKNAGTTVISCALRFPLSSSLSSAFRPFTFLRLLT